MANPFINTAYVCLVMAFISVPGAAHSARFSGEYLLTMCASDDKGRELTPGAHIACQAYIAGVLDYHNLIRSMGTSPSVDFCVPEGTTMNQLQKGVVSYIYRNKEEHAKFVAAPAVALALFDMFPCGGQKVKKRKPK